MVNDPSMTDDDLLYAQPNKKAKQAAKSVTRASGSKGKSPTGKGTKQHKSLNIYYMSRYFEDKQCFELKRIVFT